MVIMHMQQIQNKDKYGHSAFNELSSNDESLPGLEAETLSCKCNNICINLLIVCYFRNSIKWDEFYRILLDLMKLGYPFCWDKMVYKLHHHGFYDVLYLVVIVYVFSFVETLLVYLKYNYQCSWEHHWFFQI